MAKRDNMPALPLFVDDYEAATAHLSLAEDGAYMRLLRLCWRQTEKTIPADDEWIRRKMRVDKSTYGRVVKPILEEFFTRRRGRLFQKRLVSESVFLDELKQVRSAAGKLGGAASALKRRQKRGSKATSKHAANGEAKSNPHTHTHIKPPLSPLEKPTTNGSGGEDLETVAWRVKRGVTPYPALDRVREAIDAGLLTADEASERGLL